LLGNQEVKTNNKPSNIICESEKEEGLLPEKTVAEEGRVIKKQAENCYNTES
jgi:hypothetical protein